MDKKESLETTDLWVEIGKNGKGETWSRGTNLRLPFDVNVMLNLSNVPRKRKPVGSLLYGENLARVAYV